MDPCYFQDDNARCHFSRATVQWYADNNVRRLDWPSQSPDLNPIEHLWDELDSRVKTRQARPKSIAQLMEWSREEWRRIPVDVLQTLVESMPDRVAAVIATKVALRDYNGVTTTDQTLWTDGTIRVSDEIWAALNGEVLMKAIDVSLEKRRNESAGDGRSLRKTADQRHRRGRFPHAELCNSSGRPLPAHSCTCHWSTCELVVGQSATAPKAGPRRGLCVQTCATPHLNDLICFSQNQPPESMILDKGCSSSEEWMHGVVCETCSIHPWKQTSDLLQGPNVLLTLETKETGEPIENSPINGIVRHDSHVRKSGSNTAENLSRFASVRGDWSDHYTKLRLWRRLGRLDDERIYRREEGETGERRR
ncbi:hypothetical protein PR048_024132 [Dryococelus australis]|uniref:Tc1-like transposase DDE domain-containing protein n=1 Tax=Dryococelus australis TaxID=614101 RepID=A0ABQ9GW11_9NEOP|nr:hypothetical protein PR048_024132 [Dryococelus australis]